MKSAQSRYGKTLFINLAVFCFAIIFFVLWRLKVDVVAQTPRRPVCIFWKNSAGGNSVPTISPALAPTATPATSAQLSCLSQSGPLISLTGNQAVRYDKRGSPLAANTKVNASGAQWTTQWPVQDSFNYPVLLAGGPNICFSGGTVQGSYPEQISQDPNATWEYMHGTTAMIISGQNTVVEGAQILNYGDAIDFDYGAGNFTVRRVRLTSIRDDCIQNDWLYGGLVEDSLLDGCYSAFSARTYSGQSPPPVNGNNNLWTIQNSLVRLQPSWGVYKNRGLIPGHDGFFKWDDSGISPKLALHNNIFLAGQPANNVGLGIPAGKLASCSNNIMVWLGSGSYPDPLPQTLNGQPCFTVTSDKSVWENAVVDWLAKH